MSQKLVNKMIDHFQVDLDNAKAIVDDPEFSQLHVSLQLCFKIQVPACEFALTTFKKLAKDSGYETT